jgi:hypothetical protein
MVRSSSAVFSLESLPRDLRLREILDHARYSEDHAVAVSRHEATPSTNEVTRAHVQGRRRLSLLGRFIKLHELI